MLVIQHPLGQTSRQIAGQRSIRILLILQFVLGLLSLQATAAQAQSLWVWQQRIDWQFKVDQLQPEDMSAWQAQRPSDSLMIVDVREPEEFAVSHLQGAVQVDPTTSPEAFMQRFGAAVQGKTLVFYCSIGWRSSELADRLAPALRAAGAGDIRNLRGGIFRWHNESRPLVNAAGSTDWVHPYSPDWADLVARQGRTSYQPR